MEGSALGGNYVSDHVMVPYPAPRTPHRAYDRFAATGVFISLITIASVISIMVTARIPELKDCGCGVPLSVGAKIISFIFFTLSSLIFLISLYYIISTEIDLRNPDKEAQHHDETYMEVIAVMTLIVSGVHGTLAFLLWYGVKEHKPSYVLPWAILTTAFTIIFTFIAFILLLHKFSIEQLIAWLIVVVMFYCVLIVYSHFRELRREKNLPQTLSNAAEV